MCVVVVGVAVFVAAVLFGFPAGLFCVRWFVYVLFCVFFYVGDLMCVFSCFCVCLCVCWFAWFVSLVAALFLLLFFGGGGA